MHYKRLFCYVSLPDFSDLLLRSFRVDVVNSDEVVSETSIELSSASTPGNGSTGMSVTALSWLSFLLWLFNNDFFHSLLRLAREIENLDTSLSGSSNPLHLRVEGNLVDWRVGLELSGFLVKLIDVPDLDAVLFTSSSDVET